MKSKNNTALVLILVGSLILLKKFNFFPHFSFGSTWPILLILLGLLFFSQRPGKANGSTLAQLVTWLASTFVVVIVGFVLLGVLGPLFLFLLLLVPFAIILGLGAAFLKLLIPICFMAAPVILLIWFLALII